jgi:hypothetical protein
MLHHVVWNKFTDVSEVLAASIIRALVMEEFTDITKVLFMLHRISRSCTNAIPGHAV